MFKNHLRQHYYAKVADETASSSEKMLAVIFKTGKTPDLIDDKTYQNVLNNFAGEIACIYIWGSDFVIKNTDIIAIFNIRNQKNNVFKNYLQKQCEKHKYEVIDLSKTVNIPAVYLLTTKFIFLAFRRLR